ncbi:hypothetical protein GGR56DRAFT_388671 [Xylariaceae sp. FL0804]|nr:hypothetical protein GGR56DRAFT_388671 [Xylariaceae sp. FL0804]
MLSGVDPEKDRMLGGAPQPTLYPRRRRRAPATDEAPRGRPHHLRHGRGGRVTADEARDKTGPPTPMACWLSCCHGCQRPPNPTGRWVCEPTWAAAGTRLHTGTPRRARLFPAGLAETEPWGNQPRGGRRALSARASQPMPAASSQHLPERWPRRAKCQGTSAQHASLHRIPSRMEQVGEAERHLWPWFCSRAQVRRAGGRPSHEAIAAHGDASGRISKPAFGQGWAQPGLLREGQARGKEDVGRSLLFERGGNGGAGP